MAPPAEIPDNCKVVDAKEAAEGSPGFFRSADADLTDGGFIILSDKFWDILGPSPQLAAIASVPSLPFAHEAGVFIPATGEIFVTSNQFVEDGRKHIAVSRLYPNATRDAYAVDRLANCPIVMGNGGVNYDDGILFCAQGDLTTPGGLVWMSREDPSTTRTLVSSFHGRWFNSVNDVVVHSDGSLWFTDPTYGYEQSIRPTPQLPPQVYRYDPATGDIRAVADGLAHPNGICFSPDERTVYITDTDAVHGAGAYRPGHAASIYAYDLSYHHSAPFLTNRRLFAYADTGIPDGIKCDTAGNVYSGCGDGVHVWSPGGTLLGKIYVPGGCANFCFGPRGSVFLLNETKVWVAQLGPRTKGALLRI